MQVLGWILGILAALVILQFVALFVGARTTPRPSHVGTGTLAPHAPTPNNVSSLAPLDAPQYMPPISYSGSAQDAQHKLMGVLRSLPKVSVITERDGYIYIEARTKLMSFVDDVEFLFDDNAKQIHFRSAARLGQGDMGKNRARMTEIIALFQQG